MVSVYVRACVCVCERERERERYTTQDDCIQKSVLSCSEPQVTLTGDSLLIDENPLDASNPTGSLICSGDDDKPLPQDAYAFQLIR